MSSGSAELKERLAQLIPEKKTFLQNLAKEHGHKSLGDVTVNQALGGARGVKCMVWETSLLDPEEVRFFSFRFLLLLAASFDITKINRVSDSEDARSRIFRRNYLQLSKVVNRLLRVFCGFFSPETFPRKLNATVSRRNFTLVPSFRLMSRT